MLFVQRERGPKPEKVGEERSPYGIEWKQPSNDSNVFHKVFLHLHSYPHPTCYSCCCIIGLK